jgi:hypothetical protein
MLIIFFIMPASGAINILSNGVTTTYGSNITEHSAMTYLNFTANDDSDITS